MSLSDASKANSMLYSMINTAVQCLLSSHIKASAKRDMTEDCKDCSPSEVSSETASSQGASSKRRPPETSSAHLRTICMSADGPLFPNTGKSGSASLNCREDRCLCFKAGTETVVHAQRRKRSLFLSREAPPKKTCPLVRMLDVTSVSAKAICPCLFEDSP